MFPWALSWSVPPMVLPEELMTNSVVSVAQIDRWADADAGARGEGGPHGIARDHIEVGGAVDRDPVLRLATIRLPAPAVVPPMVL